jgi:hypothetical protein
MEQVRPDLGEESNPNASDLSEGEGPNVPMDEDYHTEDSEAATNAGLVASNSAPFLPAHLLEPDPDPKPATSASVATPWAKMSRKEKQNIRRSLRQDKKRMYENMREEAAVNGVVSAGLVAQQKRGKDGHQRVQTGRITKKTAKPKIELSGRQKLLESRVREQHGREAKVKRKMVGGESKG